MINSKLNNCKLVISGPGSGKTTGMIDEIIKKLPSVKPNRYISVITYTNAATENIRSKLSKKIQIPTNLFIGTIHSFLNRFIVIPYAPLFKIIPYEMCFIDEIVVNDARWKNYAVKKARDKGVISYDQIEWIAEKIVCGGVIKKDSSEIRITKELSNFVADAISNRLQTIFVDEYQDATLSQHRIFKQIISIGNCEYFYCVGDSEQYIYGFAYPKKGKKQPKFVTIPIKDFEKMEDVSKEIRTINYRSSKVIVKFLNKFSPIQQFAQAVNIQEIPISFIDETDINKIVDKFHMLCAYYCLGDKKKFYLSHHENTLNPKGPNSYRISNNFLRDNLILMEMLKYISGVLGTSQKNLREIMEIDQIELRKIGCKILETIRDQTNITHGEVSAIVANIFKMKIQKEYKGEDTMAKIRNSLAGTSHLETDYFTTIHKAKGLDAEAVLVVAETETKFKKWLETDGTKRNKESTDQCRLGFVAFSRAKQLLCLACLKNIGSFKNELKQFGIKTE